MRRIGSRRTAGAISASCKPTRPASTSPPRSTRSCPRTPCRRCPSAQRSSPMAPRPLRRRTLGCAGSQGSRQHAWVAGAARNRNCAALRIHRRVDHAPPLGGHSRSHAERTGRFLLDRVVVRNRIPRCRVPSARNHRCTTAAQRLMSLRYTTFRVISATILALALSACSGSSRSSTSSAMPASANPVQRENSRPGTSGWEVSAGVGTVIIGYASETSVAPGQSFHLHVAAPPGSLYRVLVYRLGWYRGAGGRLIMCVPGCRSSHAAIAQPPPTTPGSVTGLFRAPWRVTDRVEIPPAAVSGYYEAKLEIVGGAYAGAVGSVPLIVRQSPAAPASAVLVQVPVNTWEAYNPWGGKSLYQFGTIRHAVEVSFDRPFDQQEFHNMSTEPELPWVRFLERNGIDVSYQTGADTDRAPGSLLHHRLVFAIGHDEYWTQRMRGAFNRALALSTNLMFGSNSGEWRMRYAVGRRTIVEWRDPSMDPVHNRG